MKQYPWIAAALAFVLATPLAAQQATRAGSVATAGGSTPDPQVEARSARIHAEAESASGLRIVISLEARRLRLMDGPIVLREMPVGIGKGTTVRASWGQTWTFDTPVGKRRVLSKSENPVWVPPEWHYVEVAQKKRWYLARLKRGEPVDLSDGSRVEVRGEQVGRVDPEGVFHPVPADEEIVFDETIFIPPFGTVNRRIPGTLGRYKLELGDSYMLHGTIDPESVGKAATHGCLRLLDEDLEFLYRTVPLRTPVYIY